MKIEWHSSDHVTVDMDATEYQKIVIFLTLLELHFNINDWKTSGLAMFDTITSEIRNGMDLRSGVKQKERKA